MQHSKSHRAISNNIEVRPLTNRRDLRDFIDLPWRIYASDPAWIPPLRLERRRHLSTSNPFFQHGEWQAWLAYRNHIPVGRISAQVDELYRHRYGNNTGHFGLLEAEADTAIFAALTHTAEQWLAQRHTTHITGPYNLSVNQECGMLVEGFETPPVLMMPHGRNWYERLLMEQGYTKVKDLLAYWVNLNFEAPKVMLSLIGRYGSRVKLRTLRRKQFDEDLEILRDIFNDAWSENWAFVPVTKAEFAEFGASLRVIMPDDHVQIAEIEGEPVAFIVMLPNLNEILADLNGRLLPFGWVRLLWRLKRQQVCTGRVPLMGVRKRYQNTPLGMALAFLIIEAVRQAALSRGMKEVEMSWILEDNSGMRSILDSIGSTLYKRYRLYEKILQS